MASLCNLPSSKPKGWLLLPFPSVVDHTKEKKRKIYFNNLDLNKITDNKLFWKTVKLLLLDNGFNTTKISLVDGGKTVTEHKEIAKILN